MIPSFQAPTGERAVGLPALPFVCTAPDRRAGRKTVASSQRGGSVPSLSPRSLAGGELQYLTPGLPFPLIDQPRKHPINGFSESQKRHSVSPFDASQHRQKGTQGHGNLDQPHGKFPRSLGIPNQGIGHEFRQYLS